MFKTLSAKLRLAAAAAAFAAGAAGMAGAQSPVATPRPAATPGTPGVVVTVPPARPSVRVKIAEPAEIERRTGGESDEKSVLTATKVNVTLCVREGRVRINGWNRDEVRAFVSGGSGVGFNVMQDDPQTKLPVWINVVGKAGRSPRETRPDDCLGGDDIALDVPRGAVVKLKTGESDVRIEAVAKVTVESLDGDIFLSDIAGGVDATTFRGQLTVERVGGGVTLNNAEGNIVAIDAAPSEVGDGFRAKTNSGRILLKDVTHRLVETTSSTGATSYDGRLLSGGQYRFTATNGSIVLLLQPDALCRLNALFGFGSFASEIPLAGEVRKERSVSGQLGGGETTCGLSATTASGTVRVRKAP